MAKPNPPHIPVDPKSGFCRENNTFLSLRPATPLPPPSQPLSIAQFCLSLLSSSASSPETTPYLIDSATGNRLTFSQFVNQIHSLALHLRQTYSLSKNDVAFILCPFSFQVPVLYFSLLSLGVVVSPANPLGTASELTHQIQLSKPVIAFATSQTAHKLKQNAIRLGTVLVDSPEFLSALNRKKTSDSEIERVSVEVKQSDPAAIMYSSGTTGRVKGVLLTHRNLIALIAGLHDQPIVSKEKKLHAPTKTQLFFLPAFHIFGLVALVKAASSGETVVAMERFDLEAMLRAVERFKVSCVPVSPPLVVALVNSPVAAKYDLSSVEILICGGAPLGKEVARRFKEMFPRISIVQGYGMTETSGAASRMVDPEECERHGSVGRLTDNMEAKIVDHVTGEALPPGRSGELWLRGPTVMKGYVGDDKATAETLDSEGWLKTGDICYFDSEGFLYIVDRLKELIKYKAYQVPPAELEHILHSIPEIADAAVIPYPDEEAGQIPMAYVVRKSGSNISEAQIMEFTAKQVAPYKKIRRVAFISSIPKNPAGKILRRELVNHALSGGIAKL